jgi:hypothetical protein
MCETGLFLDPGGDLSTRIKYLRVSGDRGMCLQTGRVRVDTGHRGDWIPSGAIHRLSGDNDRISVEASRSGRTAPEEGC